MGTDLRATDVAAGPLGATAPGPVAGALRFAGHELHLWRRSFLGSAFTILLAPILYLLSIGVGLGSLVADGGASEALGGLRFAAFAGTGLMAGSAMLNGAGAMAWPVYGQLSFTGTWRSAASTSLSPRDLVLGRSVFLVLRSILADLAFAGSLALLGLVTPLRALASVGPAVLIALAAGMALFSVSATTTKDFTLPLVFRFGVTPLFLVSGTFFPVDQLPPLAERLAVLSPLWHGLELHRLVSLDVASALPWGVHVAVLVIWTIAFGALAERRLHRRLYP